MITGTVRNGRILLDEPVSVPEGTRVTVNLSGKHHLLKLAGIWKNRRDIDGVVTDIYKTRKRKK